MSGITETKQNKDMFFFLKTFAIDDYNSVENKTKQKQNKNKTKKPTRGSFTNGNWNNKNKTWVERANHLATAGHPVYKWHCYEVTQWGTVCPKGDFT